MENVMTIMSTSRYSGDEPTSLKMTFPFLWKDSNGIIFIRQIGERDIFIGGCIQLEDIGKFRSSIGSDAAAWNQRLESDVTISLRNFFP